MWPFPPWVNDTELLGAVNGGCRGAAQRGRAVRGSSTSAHPEGPPHQRTFTVTLAARFVRGTAAASSIKTAKTAVGHAAVIGLFDNPPALAATASHNLDSGA